MMEKTGVTQKVSTKNLTTSQLAAGPLQYCSIFSKILFLEEKSLPACFSLGNPRPPLGAEGGCSSEGDSVSVTRFRACLPRSTRRSRKISQIKLYQPRGLHPVVDQREELPLLPRVE